jgi:hypothetical protein
MLVVAKGTQEYLPKSREFLSRSKKRIEYRLAHRELHDINLYERLAANRCGEKLHSRRSSVCCINKKNFLDAVMTVSYNSRLFKVPQRLSCAIAKA